GLGRSRSGPTPWPGAGRDDRRRGVGRGDRGGIEGTLAAGPSVPEPPAREPRGAHASGLTGRGRGAGSSALLRGAWGVGLGGNGPAGSAAVPVGSEASTDAADSGRWPEAIARAKPKIRRRSSGLFWESQPFPGPWSVV